MGEYEFLRLANGLRVVLVPLKERSSVTVLLAVKAGSRDEPAEKAGLSHFLEHMNSKGTKKRPTPFQVAAVIDNIGGEQNAFTSKEITGYWVRLARQHLETGFDFLADNLKNPLFAPEEIERERGAIIEEINMDEDTPTRRVLEHFEAVLYGKTGLGREVMGSKETVERIQRDDFLRFRKKFYQPQNMVLVVAGGFSSSPVKEWISKYFGDWKKITSLKRKRLSWKKKRRVRLCFKKTDQAHFCLGTYGVSCGDKDRFAVAVLASVLGYCRTSRIYRRLREEKGWAYYVYTWPEFFSDTGYLVTQAGVRLTKVKEALELVQREYQRMAGKRVSISELQRAKEYLKGRLVLSLESSFNVADRYATMVLLEGKPRTVKETLRLIDQVGVEDVFRVAKRLFAPGQFSLALIGPFQVLQGLSLKDSPCRMRRGEERREKAEEEKREDQPNQRRGKGERVGRGTKRMFLASKVEENN